LPFRFSNTNTERKCLVNAVVPPLRLPLRAALPPDLPSLPQDRLLPPLLSTTSLTRLLLTLLPRLNKLLLLWPLFSRALALDSSARWLRPQRKLPGRP
jgi:hypothetical protein